MVNTFTANAKGSTMARSKDQLKAIALHHFTAVRGLPVAEANELIERVDQHSDTFHSTFEETNPATDEEIVGMTLDTLRWLEQKHDTDSLGR